MKDWPEPKDNNNNFSPPPSPPPQPPSFLSVRPSSGPPPAPPFVPPRSPNFPQPFPPPLLPQTPRKNTFIEILPIPSAPPPPPDDYFLLTPPPKFTPTKSLFDSQTQTLTWEKEETKEKVLEEIDEKIYQVPDPSKLELGHGLVKLLGAKAEDILEDNFINYQKLEDDTLETIKEDMVLKK